MKHTAYRQLPDVRARAYTPPVTHPMLMTQEPEPGHWIMGDSVSGTFAEIELRRVKVGVRYKVTVHGKVAGWTTTFKDACEGAHARHMAARAKVYAGPANGQPSK